MLDCFKKTVNEEMQGTVCEYYEWDLNGGFYEAEELSVPARRIINELFNMLLLLSRSN